MELPPKVTPVILAGGYGTRLWPLSRKSYPKQFSSLRGSTSLFQETAIRLQPSIDVEFRAPVIVTNDDFRFIVTEQLQSVGVDPGPVLIEPSAKNTAPAVLAAALEALSHDPDAILLICPSDHFIPDMATFHSIVAKGLHSVKDGNLVTFGVKPTHPETGYGYLEAKNVSGTEPTRVTKFVEKPCESVAKNMIQQGNYLWNAGIFLFKAHDMVAAFENYCPEIIAPVTDALKESKLDLGFVRLDKKSWDACESVSIDYAIMERASNLVAMQFENQWSDLGDWNAIWKAQDPDSDGVVVSENATAIGCKDVLIRSESPRQHVVGIGLDNIVVIGMPDAVLVARKDHAQDVKIAVQILKEKNVEQGEVLPKDYRPWGWYETLVDQGCFKVKYILVYAGGCLSLQSHQHRSEHWVMVDGDAKVTLDNTVTLVKEGESVYIPVGSHHRIENPGDSSLIFIEVQLGSYLGEDDIIRYEDVYQRS